MLSIISISNSSKKTFDLIITRLMQSGVGLNMYLIWRLFVQKCAMRHISSPDYDKAVCSFEQTWASYTDTSLSTNIMLWCHIVIVNRVTVSPCFTILCPSNFTGLTHHFCVQIAKFSFTMIEIESNLYNFDISLLRPQLKSVAMSNEFLTLLC